MRIIHRATHIITLAFLLNAISIFAQDRARSYGHPLSMHYDYADAPFGHQVLAMMMIGNLAPLNIRSTSIERSQMFALAGGLRFERERSRRFAWKATLIDFDRSSRADGWLLHVLYNSLPSTGYQSMYVHPYYTLGLTLIDYDRTTPMELDARWFQGRIGGGIELLRSKYFSIATDLRFGAGLTSLIPGTVNYSLPILDSTINGPELLARGKLAIRIGNVNKPRLRLSADVQMRRVMAHEDIDLLTAEGSARWLSDSQSYEVFVTLRRSTVQMNDMARGITSFHTGIHILL